MIVATMAAFGAWHGAQAQTQPSQALPQIITDAVAKQSAQGKQEPKQDIKPDAKQDAKPEVKASTAESRSAALLATSGEPVFDEGSARRMKDAIKLYKDIAARGGWGTLPTDAKFTIGQAG
ncbi:MAG: hypothetical protein Q7T73_19845, partial [Beijerinckiaceae bacterium]|nr:hypothetical protein [Beijerinckiaceae bacterium]